MIADRFHLLRLAQPQRVPREKENSRLFFQSCSSSTPLLGETRHPLVVWSCALTALQTPLVVVPLLTFFLSFLPSAVWLFSALPGASVPLAGGGTGSGGGGAAAAGAAAARPQKQLMGGDRYAALAELDTVFSSSSSAPPTSGYSTCSATQG